MHVLSSNTQNIKTTLNSFNSGFIELGYSDNLIIYGMVNCTYLTDNICDVYFTFVIKENKFLSVPNNPVTHWEIFSVEKIANSLGLSSLIPYSHLSSFCNFNFVPGTVPDPYNEHYWIGYSGGLVLDYVDENKGFKVARIYDSSNNVGSWSPDSVIFTMGAYGQCEIRHCRYTKK
jgi:hypothetical protein